jgi:hypothetical protein
VVNGGFWGELEMFWVWLSQIRVSIVDLQRLPGKNKTSELLH